MAGKISEKFQCPSTFVKTKSHYRLTFQLSPARTHEAHRMRPILGKKARMRAAATGSYWHTFSKSTLYTDFV